MRLTRRPRYVATLLALIGMLFTQLAVAAYLCPSMQIAQALESRATPAVAASHQDMAGCEGMDMGNPAPCQDHGQLRHQSLDKPELPQVSPFMAAMLVQAVSHADRFYQSVTAPTAKLFLARATAPPLSIRNCCFQI